MRLFYCDPSHCNATTRAVVEFVYGDCPGQPLRSATLNDPPAETILQVMVELIGHDPLTALVLVNQAQSFTLIRILATLYNTLAYSRNLQLYELASPQPFAQLAHVLGQPKIQIEPQYSKAPNITYATQPR